jgi:protocatechuate 3,4-dioxygenase beta subunit
MDNDDVFSPVVGRRQILRRAGAFGLLGLGLTHLATGAAVFRGLAPSDDELDLSGLLDDPTMQVMCTLTPSETQGPYYLNLNLVRSDITEGYPGYKSRIIIHVVRASDCSAVQNAAVDVWHANAAGVYSGYAQQGTQGLTFLRGVQYTDANGTAMFDTIYPGWYQGRTTHIHCKVRPSTTQELTTQLYFNQGLSNRMYSRGAYQAHGPTSTTNSQDGLFLPQTVMSLLGNVPGIGLQLELTIGVA